MLEALTEGERNLTDLAAPFDVSFEAASKHVRVLERAALVDRRREGREHVCRINAAPMRDVAAWIDSYRRYWEERFDRLDRYLRELQEKEEIDHVAPRKRKGAQRRRD